MGPELTPEFDVPEPEKPLVPTTVQPPVAPALVQFSVAELPVRTRVGFAVKETVGFDGHTCIEELPLTLQLTLTVVQTAGPVNEPDPLLPPVPQELGEVVHESPEDPWKLQEQGSPGRHVAVPQSGTALSFDTTTIVGPIQELPLTVMVGGDGGEAAQLKLALV